MGSFDMACGMSGVTLGGGQPVKLFFIISNYYDTIGAFPCYPTDHYKFCSFGIDCISEDYGQYTIDESLPAWIEFKEYLKNHTIFVEEGENKYHDLEFDPKKVDEMTPDRIMEFIIEDRVMVKGWDGRMMRIAPFPVHGDIFKEACCNPFESWNRKIFTIDTVCDSAREKVAQKVKEHAELKKTIDSLKEQLKKDGVEDDRFKSFMDNYVGFDDMGIREMFVGGYNWNDIMSRQDEDSIWGLIAELHMIYNTISSTNKMLIPTMSNGQEMNYNEAIEFHSRCAKVIIDMKKKWEIDCDEPYDN